MNPDENKNIPPTPAPTTTPPEPNTPHIRSLRTYQGDVEEIMAQNRTSISSIVLAEQKRKEVIIPRSEQEKHPEKRNTFFVVLGLLLLAIGVGANLWVYLNRPPTEVAVEQRTKTLIPYSKEKTIALTGPNKANIVELLSQERASLKLPENGAEYINIVGVNKTPETVSKVFSNLTPQIPLILTRTLDNTYMFGIYSLAGNSPFIILTTHDFGGTYSGMLAWEKTMPEDLASLFGITKYVQGFVDESYHNRDLRILRDAQKKTILLYSFIDKNTLVITTSEDVFTGILGKYLVSKNVR